VNEDTVFICAELPAGQDWAVHTDINVVELRAGMTLQQRVDAIADMQAQWHRAHLRIVQTV
jgi:hypothetical protein